ncbi:zinc finger and SCAN domain-containing protein 31-like isoform X4 [Phyllopteryx taeniolatus]|uniref:zinc finger and SCAN domain-containing protein 31-like isoform X4 n=1 Tax=Phyllopteryx taeniolatus TaxID=161469 RepID=UPI002AD36F31|nr:zinc finger and SCAN domain-containing protein 31-like isoform X4 [Phyllopteryx taeniolatus]
MCARRTAESEEELWGPKEEKEPQRQLLDAVFNLQPHTVHRRADLAEDLRTEWQEPEPPRIKEEVKDEEVHHIKEEEEPISIKKEEKELHHHIRQEKEEDITKFPLTGVPLKSEDEGQSVASRGVEPPSSSSSQHMTTEADGDHCGGSQADGPLSDFDVMTSTHDDYGQSEIDMTFQTDNKRWKCSQCGKTFDNKSTFKQHVRTHTGEKTFSCSDCGQRFSIKKSLKIHTRTHTGPELGDQHQLRPQKGPAEDVLPAASEKARPATGAAETVRHSGHRISPVFFHHSLVWCCYKKGQTLTATDNQNC